MNCPKCHAENKPNAKFCTECGIALNAPAAVELHDVDEFAMEKTPPPRVVEELDLAPELPKAPARAVPQGPPRVDLDAEPELDGEKTKDGKKVKKPLPERPRDYNRESKGMLIAGGVAFVALCFIGGYVGLAGLIAAVFGALAMLESLKVDEFYKAGDYEGAETASLSARRYLKIGIIAAVVALFVTVAIAVVMFVFAKISNVVAPKTDF